jgi:hypothetical protein
LAQFSLKEITDRKGTIEEIVKNTQHDIPRFNYTKYGALIPAIMIDATIKVDGQWFSGKKVKWESQINWVVDALEHHAWNFKWIPFNNGKGEVPEEGSLVSQEAVSAILLGVYEDRNHPRIKMVMPESGFLQVKNVKGGSFQVAPLEGIECSALGSEEEDYRKGIVGLRSNSWRTPNTSNSDQLVVIPVFQLTFPSNFLMDYYLYVKKDDRIPFMVKSNLDVVLKNITPIVPGDNSYKQGSGKWGIAKYKNPYALTNPISNDGNSYELPQYARMCAFVLKTLGNDSVNSANYAEWYDRLIDSGNVNPSGILIWQWKTFGQFYGWSQDASWMMAQENLESHAPLSMRNPIQYNRIPE